MFDVSEQPVDGDNALKIMTDNVFIGNRDCSVKLYGVLRDPTAFRTDIGLRSGDRSETGSAPRGRTW